jgi:DNA-binding transcriptional MerR regulator
LLSPSLYTRGGERRYTQEDLTQLRRILELREVLGMNLDEIREFLSFETRLDELRVTYRATKGATTKRARAEQKATLREALELNESLAEQLNAKLARMDTFRAKLAGTPRSVVISWLSCGPGRYRPCAGTDRAVLGCPSRIDPQWHPPQRSVVSSRRWASITRWRSTQR